MIKNQNSHLILLKTNNKSRQILDINEQIFTETNHFIKKIKKEKANYQTFNDEDTKKNKDESDTFSKLISKNQN